MKSQFHEDTGATKTCSNVVDTFPYVEIGSNRVIPSPYHILQYIVSSKRVQRPKLQCFSDMCMYVCVLKMNLPILVRLVNHQRVNSPGKFSFWRTSAFDNISTHNNNNYSVSFIFIKGHREWCLIIWKYYQGEVYFISL